MSSYSVLTFVAPNIAWCSLWYTLDELASSEKVVVPTITYAALWQFVKSANMLAHVLLSGTSFLVDNRPFRSSGAFRIRFLVYPVYPPFHAAT